MDRNDLLKKMVADYEEILQNVSNKLKEVKDFAKSEGIALDSDKVESKNNLPASLPNAPVQNNMMKEFNKQRQAMMEHMNKIREDAKKQAQEAMEEANKMKTSMPSMPFVPQGGFPMIPSIPVDTVVEPIAEAVVEGTVISQEVPFQEVSEPVVVPEEPLK